MDFALKMQKSEKANARDHLSVLHSRQAPRCEYFQAFQDTTPSPVVLLLSRQDWGVLTEQGLQSSTINSEDKGTT